MSISYETLSHMQYKISPNDLQLKSSFKVKKEAFARELAKIREKHPECRVWKRSLRSLKLEWAAHNALHALGIFRSRTGDADLNWPQPWYIRLGYAILGTLTWPFIK